MSVIYSSQTATSDKQDEQSSLLSSILTQVESLASGENDEGIIAQLNAIYGELTAQATSDNQVISNTTLASILAALSGVATASNQGTANTTLASILTQLGVLATASKQDTANNLLSSINDKIGSSSAALSSVAQQTSSQVVLAANPNRRGYLLYNDSGQKAMIAYAATATSAAFSILLGPNSGYESDQTVVYRGVMSVIWSGSGGGSLKVTELS